jgi:hypothetical protein
MKVVYNGCFGGFGLSKKALQRGRELSGNSEWGSDDRDLSRHDPILIKVVEELGVSASDEFADLLIKEIPDGSPYYIDEYDGSESVQTKENIPWVIP